MPRLAKFHDAQFLDAARRVVSMEGPSGATISAIAQATGAPTGSLYHRFPSRDVLLGEVWLQAADAFQSGYCAVLRGPDAHDAGLAAIRYFVERVRANLPEARTLLLYRREDFIDRGWPKAMERRAAQLAEQSRRELRAFTRRLTGRSDQQAVRMLAYALLEAPLAAVRRHIEANEVPPPYIDRLVAATYEAVVRLVA